eukprot:7958252-Lingulodinium_polyedra.AAC.1
MRLREHQSRRSPAGWGLRNVRRDVHRNRVCLTLLRTYSTSGTPPKTLTTPIPLLLAAAGCCWLLLAAG